MAGAIVKLKHPIAVMEMTSKSGDDDAGISSDRVIKIVYLIREKYLFATRPSTVCNKEN